MDTIIPQDVNPPQKQCKDCEKVFPATPEYFQSNKTYKNGLCHSCKECRSKYIKQHYQENKKKYKDNSAKRRQNKREELLEYFKQYSKDHKEEKREYDKQYIQTERGKIAQRVHSHKRRAQKRNVGGSYTVHQLQDQLKRQRNKCYWCHKKLGKNRKAWHADHIIPLSREHTSNTIDNIVISCPECNLRKHNKLPHEWPEGGRLL